MTLTLTRPPELKGQRLLLRPACVTDLWERLAIGEDPEFSRLLGDLFKDVQQWYAAMMSDPYGWVIEYDDYLVGYARLYRVSLCRRDARLAIGLFQRENRGKGLGTEATLLVLDYAFGKMALDRIELKVLRSNAIAIACYEKCGFQQESRPRRKGGNDVIWMGIDRERHLRLSRVSTVEAQTTAC